MTDRHESEAGKPDRGAEARRILAQVERDSGLAASSALARAVGRARNHMAGADADPEDWAEVWGTRIGRLLSLAAFVALSGPRITASTTALAQVKALGFSADDVRHIAVTHLDLDHAGGLADFPRARVHVHGAEQRAAMAPNWRERMRYKPHQWAHGPDWRLYDQADGEPWFGFACVRALDGLPPEVLLVPMGGHSRGHSALAVDAGDRWLLHAGDAYFAHGEVHEGAAPVAPLLDVYETILAADNGLRRGNQQRLRQLAREQGAKVSVFCAHDPAEMPATRS